MFASLPNCYLYTLDGTEEGAETRGLDSYTCSNLCEYASGGTTPRFVPNASGGRSNEIWQHYMPICRHGNVLLYTQMWTVHVCMICIHIMYYNYTMQCTCGNTLQFAVNPSLKLYHCLFLKQLQVSEYLITALHIQYWYKHILYMNSALQVHTVNSSLNVILLLVCEGFDTSNNFGGGGASRCDGSYECRWEWQA